MTPYGESKCKKRIKGATKVAELEKGPDNKESPSMGMMRFMHFLLNRYERKS